MNKTTLQQILVFIPQVRALITTRARFVLAEPAEYKTYDYMLSQIIGMVQSVYYGRIGGEFVDMMGSLIAGQMRNAFQTAMYDEFETVDLPPYLQNALDAFTVRMADFDFIYQYYKDIIDARVDGTLIDPLIARASLWANRWNDAYSEALRAIGIENGSRMVWILGGTEEHCTQCAALNGLVAFAKEWEASGFHPQGAPNPMLECGGWQCDCSLIQTDRRRSPHVMQTLMNLAER